MSTRAGVLPGKVIALRVLFEDSIGDVDDPSATPQVYLYPASVTVDIIDAEVVANVFTGLGPYPATKVATGYYELLYTVPSGAEEGQWTDLWVWGDTEQFNFVVLEPVAATLQGLANNLLVVLVLDASIASITGELLGIDNQFTFSTTFVPLYASPELVRAEVGPWIDFIPDDTLNLLIHWSSKEADFLTPKSLKRLQSTGWYDDVLFYDVQTCTDEERFMFARTKFCIYDTAIRALLLPGSSQAGNFSGGGSKSLGDLKITSGGAGIAGMGLTSGLFDTLKKERDLWKQVVNSRGTLMPGQGLNPTYAVLGFANPDRRNSGRGLIGGGALPTVNSKVRIPGTRKHKNWYRDES